MESTRAKFFQQFARMEMFSIYKMFNIGRQCKMYFTECRNKSFFYKNIWSCQKKVVPLQCN